MLWSSPSCVLTDFVRIFALISVLDINIHTTNMEDTVDSDKPTENLIIQPCSLTALPVCSSDKSMHCVLPAQA